MGSRPSTPRPWCSAAAASRPTCRCARSTSARWSAPPSARHPTQPGRRPAHGNGDRRHAWGQWSGCHAQPISADWGRVRAREYTDRSNRLSYHYGLMITAAGAALSTRARTRNLYTYAKFRPRHPGRARRKGLPAVRQQGAAPAGAALFDVQGRSSPSRSRSCGTARPSMMRSRRSRRWRSSTRPSAPTKASTPPGKDGTRQGLGHRQDQLGP